MKRGLTLISILVISFILAGCASTSNQPAEKKKALDAFITATTKSTTRSEPVPGAEIIVEIVKTSSTTKNRGIYIPDTAQEKPQKSRAYSNNKGEALFIVPAEQFKKLPGEFFLKFTIKPKDPGKFPVETNSVLVKVKKSNGPKYAFVITWQEVTSEKGNVKASKRGTTNKGTFAVNSKAQT